MTTLEQVRKAYDDLSDFDKKSFCQLITTHDHRGIGDVEFDDDSDSPSATNSENNTFGAEHASGNGDIDTLNKSDKTAWDADDKSDNRSEDDREESKSENETIKSLRKDIATLAARIERIERMPQKADDATASRLFQLERLYD